jgi:hypothetical protein
MFRAEDYAKQEAITKQAISSTACSTLLSLNMWVLIQVLFCLFHTNSAFNFSDLDISQQIYCVLNTSGHNNLYEPTVQIFFLQKYFITMQN